MRGLFIDTANQNLHLLLLQDQHICASIVDIQSHNQAADLLPVLERLLQQANWSYADLEYLATIRGKGSFTGIRIALTVVKMLQLLLKLPVAACTTFELLSWPYRQLQDFVLLTPAERNKIYVAEFQAEKLVKVQLITATELKYIPSTHILAELTLKELLATILPASTPVQYIQQDLDDEYLATILPTWIQTHPQEELTPLYVREPDINCKFINKEAQS